MPIRVDLNGSSCETGTRQRVKRNSYVYLRGAVWTVGALRMISKAGSRPLAAHSNWIKPVEIRSSEWTSECTSLHDRQCNERSDAACQRHAQAMQFLSVTRTIELWSRYGLSRGFLMAAFLSALLNDRVRWCAYRLTYRRAIMSFSRRSAEREEINGLIFFVQLYTEYCILCRIYILRLGDKFSSDS